MEIRIKKVSNGYLIQMDDDATHDVYVIEEPINMQTEEDERRVYESVLQRVLEGIKQKQVLTYKAKVEIAGNEKQ